MQPGNLSEEQVRELQEKIKNMSPEELKEFQMKNDIFHQIVLGKVPAKKVYEDETALAILDIHPASLGHMLVLTKEYYTIMPQVPDDELAHMAMVVKTLSNASLRSLEAGGVNIVVANGIAAGQRAQHFMMHIIPRKEGDNINFELPQKTIPEKELLDLQKRLSSKLGKELQAKQPQQQVPPQEKEPQEEPQPEPAKQEKPAEAPVKEEAPQEEPEDDLDDIAKLLGAK